MNSPIATLTEILENVVLTAENYKSQLQGNEAATRSALIDPVLRSLGWDISNPSRVLVEKTQTIHGQQLRVDYALLADGDVKLVVEAKKLGGHLEDHFLQIVNYAFGLKIKSIFISDGIRWRHYLNLSTENQRAVWDVNLLNVNLSEVAAYLIRHLDAALVAPETPKIDELAQKIENLEKKVALLEKTSTERLVEPLKQLQGTIVLDNPIAHNFETLDATKDYTGRKPTGVLLPDGTQKAISQWKPVLVEVCSYVLENVSSVRSNMPFSDKAGRSVNLISLSRPLGNVSSAAVEVDGQTFYIHTNYSANSIVANVLYLQAQIPTGKNVTPTAVSFEKSK